MTLQVYGIPAGSQEGKSANSVSDNICRHFSDPVPCRVIDAIKDLNAPRQTLRAGATQSFVPKTIETKIPKFKSVALVFALAVGIKFRMEFIEQVTILLRHRMGLQEIRANGDHATLTQNDATMTLGSVDVKAKFLRQLVDVAGAVDVAHETRFSAILLYFSDMSMPM